MRACRPPVHTKTLRAILGITAAAALACAPLGAQTLLHRYSFNGSANDSVGTAHGTVVGAVSLLSAWGSNGSAVFSGGTSGGSPGYIRLPVSAVSGLQNATIEIFTANFDIPNEGYGQPGGRFQTLFALATAYGNQTNYAILCPNRAGTGLGLGARRNAGVETVVACYDPLPVWRGNHVVHLIYSGFNGIGTTGLATLYLDGTEVAQGPTACSFASVAAGQGGVNVAGIGGGSPFNDPTFRGSINEVRIYDGVLTTAQIAANLVAGPAALGFTPPYTPAEAARALQIAAGLGAPRSAWEASRLNVAPGGAPAGVDILDALSIARKAVGQSPNP